MKLVEKQKKFTRAVNYLLTYIHSLGYEVTFGDCYRDPRCDYGNMGSTHRKRLAIDINLFVDDKYIDDGEHPTWVVLHQYWRLLGGSEVIKNDQNHFSFKHHGIR